MPEKITYAPLEHTNESDHGTFPWGKGIDGTVYFIRDSCRCVGWQTEA